MTLLLFAIYFNHESLFSLGSPYNQEQYNDVYNFLLAQSGVSSVHDVRIWTLGHKSLMFSAHIVMGGKRIITSLVLIVENETDFLLFSEDAAINEIMLPYKLKKKLEKR